MTGTTDIAGRVLAGRVDALLVGFGLANRAVAAALVERGHGVVAVDDRPTSVTALASADLGLDLVATPTESELDSLVRGSDVVFPTPGLPDHHPAIRQAMENDVPIAGELDLARAWDQRPLVGVTGTNGKTTVVELCVAGLEASGVESVAAGNTDLPLVAAIGDPAPDVIVVEASSFRLGHAQRFSPSVGTWLNFAPDHLDVHHDLDAYERAKARIWAHLGPDSVAVANDRDPVVMRNLPDDRPITTFGSDRADWRIDRDRLVGPDGDLMAVGELWRAMPHDLVDALAAAASVTSVGASAQGLAAAFATFDLAAHRVQHVANVDGVAWYDDSKATTPHATVAALQAFESAVLIAGGRNKGIALSDMLEGLDRVHAVVAIGDSTDQIVALFEPTREVRVASDMDEAVAMAAELAPPGGVVLLSPGCASYDWYSSYGERGDDFGRAVRARAGVESRGGS